MHHVVSNYNHYWWPAHVATDSVVIQAIRFDMMCSIKNDIMGDRMLLLY